VDDATIDADAFNAFEASGWEAKAGGYDRFVGGVTGRFVEPLLDAARVREGTRLLDLATGPGYAAARAAERGASVVGVDVAAAMVVLAAGLHPGLEFRQADAHELPFDDASFDAVVGNFLILHLGRPEQAMAEAVRVLRPGGALALTTWDFAERVRMFGVFLDAIAEAGATPPRSRARGAGRQACRLHAPRVVGRRALGRLPRGLAPHSRARHGPVGAQPAADPSLVRQAPERVPQRGRLRAARIGQARVGPQTRPIARGHVHVDHPGLVDHEPVVDAPLPPARNPAGGPRVRRFSLRNGQGKRLTRRLYRCSSSLPDTRRRAEGSIAAARGGWEACAVDLRAPTARRAVAAGVLCALLLVPPNAAAAGSSAREVAAALRADPVYVARSEQDQLTVPDQGRIRLRIVRKDIGRIQMAVVSPRSAERAGGLGELANAVDQAMPGRRGALVVTTGSAFHVVTSHAAVQPTAAALRAAAEKNRNRGLDTQLLAAVDGIAEVDPGADADANAPSPALPVVPAPSPQPDDLSDDVGDSFRLGVLIVAAAIAIPFLLGAMALLLAWRRRREAAEDRQELDRGDARDELIALGEEIQALDLDVDMPNASPRGREEYERALKLYDRANQLLGRDDPSEVELYEARRSLEEGHQRLAAAREALTTGQGV
jgi:SAM-dependent methyltransferase